MIKEKICILGGSGFVGSHLAALLTRAGYDVRIPTRRRERHRDLLVLPTVEVIETSISDSNALRNVISGCDAVINLVAILNESRHARFRRIHVELPRAVVDACREMGVKRLLHMSALNADATNGPSQYLRTKGEGEAIVHNSVLDVTSFRPSVIFGPGDHFFNRFAHLLKLSPGFMPLACAGARFAPVYVEDVAHAFLMALRDHTTIGQRYDLCGPKTYTLLQLVEYTNKLLDTRRAVIGLGDGLSQLMATALSFAPGKPMTRDNYLSMKVDAVCRAHANTLPLDPLTPIEAVVPLYVGRKQQRALYDAHRSLAARNPENSH
jgi:NADH dehydrogenase